MSNVTPIASAVRDTVSQLNVPMANTRPLYIFSLDSFCRKGRRIGGPDAEYDDEVIVGVADTLMALNFAGAECWIVSDRGNETAAQTADWLMRHELGASQVYLNYVWGSEMGLDEEDMARLKAVFERAEYASRWEGLPVYSFTPAAGGQRILLA